MHRIIFLKLHLFRACVRNHEMKDKKFTSILTIYLDFFCGPVENFQMPFKTYSVSYRFLTIWKMYAYFVRFIFLDCNPIRVKCSKKNFHPHAVTDQKYFVCPLYTDYLSDLL